MYHPGGRILLRPDAMPIHIDSAALASNNVEVTDFTPNFENIEIPKESLLITGDFNNQEESYFEDHNPPEGTTSNVAPKKVDDLEEICQSRFLSTFLNIFNTCSYRVSEKFSSNALLQQHR